MFWKIYSRKCAEQVNISLATNSLISRHKKEITIKKCMLPDELYFPISPHFFFAPSIVPTRTHTSPDPVANFPIRDSCCEVSSVAVLVFKSGILTKSSPPPRRLLIIWQKSRGCRWRGNGERREIRNRRRANGLAIGEKGRLIKSEDFHEKFRTFATRVSALLFCFLLMPSEMSTWKCYRDGLKRVVKWNFYKIQVYFKIKKNILYLRIFSNIFS